MTGAAADDPTNISTFNQTGAQFGYTQLWTVLVSIPMMIAVQEMCARIAIRTGTGLTEVMRAHYAKPLLYTSVALLWLANTVNIGADLGAMASSMQLLIRLPFILWLIFFTLFSLLLLVLLEYARYARYLRVLTLSLLAYVVVAMILPQDWGRVLKCTLVPTLYLSKAYWLDLAAILGTNISPYLFFWQANNEVEEMRRRRAAHPHTAGDPLPTRLHRRRLDVALGMIYSNVVSWCMILTATAVFFRHGQTRVESVGQAALALRPLAGNQATALFTAGIVGSGLLVVPILAGSAAYAIAEACGWRHGLNLKFQQAPGFYGVIILSTLIGTLLNLIGINPIRALYYAAALNGMIAPLLLVAILFLANNPAIMREQRNGGWSNTIVWITVAVMLCAVLGLLLSA